MSWCDGRESFRSAEHKARRCIVHKLPYDLRTTEVVGEGEPEDMTQPEDDIDVFTEWEVESSAAYEMTSDDPEKPDVTLTLMSHAEPIPDYIVNAIVHHDPPVKEEGNWYKPSAKLDHWFDSTFGFGFEDGRIWGQRLFVADGKDISIGSLDAVTSSLYDQIKFYSDADREAARNAILNYPVPLFGSPPQGIEILQSLAAQSPTVAIAAYSVATAQPVLAVMAGGTAIAIWLLKPAGHVVRRTMAQKLAHKLGTQYHRDDEK